MKRELATGFLLGSFLGAIGYLRIILWPQKEILYTSHYQVVGVTVGCSVLGVVMWGTIAGSMLPLFLKKMKIDPATASAPFVATLVDVTGIIIYFSVAAHFLKGSLL